MSDALRERWLHIERILNEARDLPAVQLPRFLERACGGDAELRREVESLLAAAPQAGRLDRGVVMSGSAGETAAPEVSDGLPAGTPLGAYRIVKTIGRGGMGEVYLAERADGAFEHAVAVKVMRAEAAEHLLRFEAERQILARLEHPGIARLLDGGVAPDGRPYMIMEHVRGQPLAVYARERALPLAERLGLFLQVCEAVAYAHANLVVHRDLKPNNILVTPEGRAKLLDFGVAKLLGPGGGFGDGATLLGAAPLTPDHAAPEQLQGKPVTTATDVYALGIVLYELLAGRSPFAHLRDLPVSAALDHLLHTDPKFMSAIAAEQPGPPVPPRALAGDLDAIVAKAIRKRAADRYPTVVELQADIQRFLDGRPVAAGPDSAAYRASKFVRRHRVAVGVAAAILALVTGFTLQLARERDRALRSEVLAKSEAQAARQVTEYLVNLFEGASPEQTAGQPIEPRKLVDRGRAALEDQLASQPLLRARMLGTLGRVYCKLGVPLECKAALQQALDLHRGQPEHDRLLEARYLDELALATFDLGEFEPAERLHREAAQILESVVPPADGRIVDVKVNIARALRERQKIAESVAELEQLQAIVRRHQGEDSAEYAAVLHALGPTYQEASRPDDAKRAAGHSVEITRRVFGENHPEYAARLHSLALVLKGAEDNAGAEATYRKALEVKERIFGADSDKLVNTLSDLAVVIKDQGRTRDALPYMRRTLDISRVSKGADTMEFAVSLNNLAVILVDLGDFAEALTLLEEAHRIRARVEQGAPTVRGEVVRLGYGRVLCLVGRPADGIRLLEQEFPRQLEGAEARMARGRALRHLGDCHMQARDYARAARLFDQTEAFHREFLPADHWFFDTMAARRGEWLAAQGRHADAVPLLERAAKNYERDLGASAPGVLEAKLALAESLAALGRAAEAQALVEQAAPVVERQLAASHGATVRLGRLRKRT